MNGCWILSNAFSASNEMFICFFLIDLVYIVDFIDRFLCIEPSLYPWNEAYLIMMDDHFDVFLDLVFENFIEYFCINIHNERWSDIYLLGLCVV